MQTLDDIALLRQYADSGSEAAFEALVSRRIGFVYSAALRQVGNTHLAEEVTQMVFILLARKARRISDQTALSGWLFNTTRLTALAQIRAAAKRRDHEQQLQMENEPEPAPTEPLWQQISPLLDEALGTLGEKDRRALLLRYFEDKTLAEVGQALAVGEDGARKRVARALEKLHDYFVRRGISSTAVAVAGTLAAHAVHAAPAALAKSVTAVAVAQGAAASGSTFALVKGALKFMVWSKTQTAAVGLVVAGLAAISIQQHRSQTRLREENGILRQQQETLQVDNERLSNLAAQAPSAPAPQVRPSQELLSLRGEVGLLRRETNELRSQLVKAAEPQAQPHPQVQAPAPSSLPGDYPQTPEAATRGILEALSRGNFQQFLTNFIDPSLSPLQQKMQSQQHAPLSNLMAGAQVVSIGQPTNSSASNTWLVPYGMRFSNGQERQFLMKITQNPSTQRYIFQTSRSEGGGS
jgi:RNA polymerase sigma factor (sigma-70 family)